MSSDEQEDDITIVTSHHSEYAASEPGAPPHKVKSGKHRLSGAERLHCDVIEHYKVDPVVYLKTPQQQKRHIFKKSLFPSIKDDISMSASADPVKELTEEELAEQQIHLIPKLPGQMRDEIKIPTRQVFEYAYKKFTDNKVRKYLEDIQPWLYFRRCHNKPDYSLPVLDHTGKQYTELKTWTLVDIDALPANVQKLCETQSHTHKHSKSVPIDTLKTSQTDKPISTQTTSTTTTSQSISVSQAIATAINKNTGTSGSPPPSPPTPPRNNTPTSSQDSSPDRMPSLRDRAVFFPQATFKGKDISKTQTHLQSFGDFVDRQRLDPEKDFKEIQEYFLMTLHDLARQWFTSTKFSSYDDMKKRFIQEYSEYGKTP